MAFEYVGAGRCEHCGSLDMEYLGESYDEDDYLGSSYKCLECDHQQIINDNDYPDECPKCGSSNTNHVGGDSVVDVSRGLVHESHYKCATCGHWWRETD